MNTVSGYTTAVDAMNVADEEGLQRYWMNYRIVFVNRVGAYDYLLTNRQDWESNSVNNGTTVIAVRERNNSFPSGFTNWQYQS